VPAWLAAPFLVPEKSEHFKKTRAYCTGFSTKKQGFLPKKIRIFADLHEMGVFLPIHDPRPFLFRRGGLGPRHCHARKLSI